MNYKPHEIYKQGQIKGQFKEMEKDIKIREMNKEIFQNNFFMTLKEILPDEELNLENIKFKILPVEEKGKGYNAKDDIMRLVLLSEKKYRW